ncbi:YbdK family carboxylate-amine ligase [Nocardioides guangzhouensis]|uniref:Putative glutamate--cysteine ligase 2 n=1 Tax=Nocardioides guangzhouensis TaxID=2497878 RepID=A0A4Q4Z237_9ACTN|nr:glutamate--cysteine ligase [Nocardioides guangzhouensis]RYP81582.1 YbdK family carboxylate-amine ligase [Nocardioides guangzhouensis]
MSVRRVGIEEEFLLVDADTGSPVPVAREVLARCTDQDPATGPVVKPEFFLAQVEVNSRPHRALAEAGAELAETRSRIASVAADAGALLLAVPLPPFPDGPTGAGTLCSPGDRYERIRTQYGAVADSSLMCAMHVHVEVADDEEAVGIVNRVRPWVPLLVALSANSPYWRGADTGYASWRSRLWNAWPTSGPTEVFADASEYHRLTRQVVAAGSALDIALVNFDVRISSRYPTVEFRVADVCTDLRDALVVAALTRAAVEHASRAHDVGVPLVGWRTEALRSASWRAARFGLTDRLLCPMTAEPVPAAAAVDTMLATLHDELADAGDLDLVLTALKTGTATAGAQVQRQVFADAGPAGLLADLARRSAGTGSYPSR